MYAFVIQTAKYPQALELRRTTWACSQVRFRTMSRITGVHGVCPAYLFLSNADWSALVRLKIRRVFVNAGTAGERDGKL